MPRRNLLLIVIVAIVSAVCFRQADSAHRSEYGQMYDTFTEVLKKVDQDYLREVDNRVLFEGALQGMVSKLDPYSAYIGPKQFPDLKSTLEQKFDGLGIRIGKEEGSDLPIVISPMADSPAFLAGVRAGDSILQINGTPTAGVAVDKIVERLREQTDGAVRLTVRHKGEAGPVELSVERASFAVPVVLGDSRGPDNQWSFLLDGHKDIGYLRITSFGQHTDEELRKALEWLRERKVRGVILDLRNNGGGMLSKSIEVCNLFLKEGRIVSTRGRQGVEKEVFNASGAAEYANLPLVILVNQYTASASEIVAACLQDHKRAIIIGQRSWGKGTVQNVIELEHGRSGLKLTTASYWRPSGRDIHRHEDNKQQTDWGVQPDAGYEVKLTDEETQELAKARDQRDVVRAGGTPAAEADDPSSTPDPQLAKALEALQSLLAK
ncbi:MAG TPA: S41 family peptidase [Pirellulales bacterium]|jgi:carboxyl-terminal processing protease